MTTCTHRVTVRETRSETRRTALVSGIRVMWGMIAAALGVPASAYLFGGSNARQPEGWIEVGDVTDLPGGKPVEMVFRHDRADGWKKAGEKLSAWVVRTGEGDVVAFGPRCTHLGCAHRWDDAKKQFVCPCHNSLFSIDGKVCAGPAPRPLDRYEVKLEGKKLLLGALRKSSENVT